MALRSVNLFSASQRNFGKPTSTGANLFGGWTATANASKATTTLTLSGAVNGTYTTTAHKTFTLTINGFAYNFIADANFTVSGGSATVAVTAENVGYNYNDINNGGLLPNTSNAFTQSTVLATGTGTAAAITGGQGNPDVAVLFDQPVFFRYIPDDPVNSLANTLVVRTNGTNDVTLLSPVVALGEAENLLATTYFVSDSEVLEIIGKFNFKETPTGSNLGNTAPKSITSVGSLNMNLSIQQAIAPAETKYVQLEFTITKSGGSLPNQAFFAVFDPVIADFTYANSGEVAQAVYNDMPNFMLTDDQHINDLFSKDSGTAAQATLTLTSCTNGTYPIDTPFTVTVGDATYTYNTIRELTVSGGSGTAYVQSEFNGLYFNDVTHGGQIPNGSTAFTFSGVPAATTTLTLAGCDNATYPAGTPFSITSGGVTYTYTSDAAFTVSGGAVSGGVAVTADTVGFTYNDVANGGSVPNTSNTFTFSGIGSGSVTAAAINGGGKVTAGTGDVNGIINGANGTDTQPDLPLKNFIDSLCRPIDVVYNSAKDFEYIHATEGTLSRSTLADPRTAPAAYLPWIAAVTGSTLLSSASGFTPWTALEAYDGDSGGDPGEWEDFEVLSNWNAVQDLDPDFFDELQSHRDQLTTGFTGIRSGKIETMENFLNTVVDTDTPSNFTVKVTNEKFNNPFRIQSLVDPAVDPDAGGTLIKDALNAGAPAGAIAASTSNVIESGDGSYDMSGILTGTLTGAQVAPDNFIDDRDGFNRSILFNTGLTGDLGGGIGTSQYTADSAYLLGEAGSIVTARDTGTPITYGPSLNFAGDDTAVDIIVELTNFTPFEASAWTSADTSSGGAPHDSFLREKRLLVCGGDYNNTNTFSKAHDNDWAFYVVSGFGTAADPKMRLLWVDGYMQETATNYAYSAEIDMSTATEFGPIVFRVSKSASDVVKFYVQSSIYDDWDSNELAATPSTAITPTIDASAGDDAGVQIGGSLSNSKWSDASVLPAAFRRVMINNAVFSFTGSGSTSSENHALVDGKGVDDFGTVKYSPLIEFDISGVAKYATTFDGTEYIAASNTTRNVPATVNKPTKDVNFLAMEPHGTHGNLWYFGNNDTLAVSGLSSADYDWRVTSVNTSTGAIVTADGGATATTFSFAAGTYGGLSVVSIDVVPNGDSFGANGAQAGTSVAYFTPSTIGAVANPASATGTDNKSKTWTLTRTFPTVTTEYAPSQIIDKPAVQAYKGAPVIAEAPQLEFYTPFSIGMQVRRHWKATSGTEYNIFSLLNTQSPAQGLKIFYEDNKLKATFSDGTFTETVSYTETTFGDWKNVVVQRDPQTGFRLYVNGTLAETATINSSLTAFAAPTTVGTFGQGTASQYYARFSLSHFAFFNRFLSTNEISLLNSQLT